MKDKDHFLKSLFTVYGEKGTLASANMIGTYVKAYIGEIKRWIGDTSKSFLMLILLKPSADFLPANWSYYIAKLVGLTCAFIPFYGLKTNLQLKYAFSMNFANSILLSKDSISRPFCDYIFLRRTLKGKENPDDWTIIEQNREIVQPLIDSNKNFILATGHFSRQAVSALYLDRIIPSKIRISSIIARPVKPSRNPRDIFPRHHYGQMIKTIEFLRHHNSELRYVGHKNLFYNTVKSLEKPGNIVLIHVDPAWKQKTRGFIGRPFASKEIEYFATGASRLSKMTRTPIVLCLPHVKANNIVVLEWVKVIDSPDLEDSESDERITNMLLDEIEYAIGERPAQYVVDFLGKRRWNRQSKIWQ